MRIKISTHLSRLIPMLMSIYYYSECKGCKNDKNYIWIISNFDPMNKKFESIKVIKVQ